jgi:Asp-tRNA(Asn)/Glu-tRNA(Gln) amidotransferase A subunit family amidase
MPSLPRLSRKEFLLSAAASLALARQSGASSLQAGGQTPQGSDITLDDLKSLEKIAGIQFTDEERASVLQAVRSSRGSFEAIRAVPIDNQAAPPTPFKPQGRMPKAGEDVSVRPTPVRGLKVPASKDDIAFLSTRELGHLIRTKQISPVELTRLYLDRLQRYGDKLLCLVTLTEELALKEARTAEDEAMRGRFRGPLHGIPYGLKDLFAVPGYPTTWGSEPHKNQRIEVESAAYQRLREAGAVLVAKLSMGALAQGDVWFKGRTKNPWNLQQGSSGSSAGSACAAAAGLVGFAIGTETLGSIMSPSHQCRVSGLRPTFGRVSRHGAMCLSYTMDKVGPICRSIEDCSLVFAAICGADPRDDASMTMPFAWNPRLDLKRLKIGYSIGQNDDPADLSRLEKDDYLKALVAIGLKPVPIKLSGPPRGATSVLAVESAAAFDAFTRGEAIRQLTNSAWPHTFRSNRYVPAVEYLAAQRARRHVMERFEQELGDYDLIVLNERGGGALTVTNLTGHPQALVPLKCDEQGRQRSSSVIGRLYEEDRVLALAHAIQLKVGNLSERPDLSAA